jgi:protein phosphatase
MCSAVLEVSNFLSELLRKGEVKNNILDIDIKKASNREIAYRLGKYLESKCDDIKVPRVYQFLTHTLKPSIDEVEDDLTFLLNIISPKKRDETEEIIERDKYRVELFSSVGLTRLENQDYLGYLEVEDGIVLMVADGVGGGESGEIASQLVVESIKETLKAQFNPRLPKDLIEEILRNSILKANRQLVEFAESRNKSTMATTLSMILILNETELFIAHVGDSRIYELEDDTKDVKQITEDHSVREVLYRTKKITKEERDNYKKNILAYVVGKSNLKPDNVFVKNSPLNPNSRFLLCSDGFWEKVVVSKKVFNIPFNALKEQIYSKIPTDNVTVIRYFPKQIKKNPNLYQKSEIDIIEDIKREILEDDSNSSNSFNNNFSNRESRSRIFQKKRYIFLIAVTLIVVISALFIFLL